MIPTLGEILGSASSLPAADSGHPDLATPQHLLAEIVAAFEAPGALSGRRQSPRDMKFLDWSQQQLAAGARLSLESASCLRDPRSARAERWLGSRLCWWPCGIPDRPWFSIVSSRLGRRLELRPEWFRAFRTACVETVRHQAVLLTGASTTTAKYVDRAGELFGLPTLVVHAPRDGDAIAGWIRRLPKWKFPITSSRTFHAVLSPWLKEAASAVDESITTLPLCDRAVLAWSDRMYVPHLRPTGSLVRLIRAWLQESELTVPNVLLAIGRSLVPCDLAEELVRLGAAAWPIPQEKEVPANEPTLSTVAKSPLPSQLQSEQQLVDVERTRANLRSAVSARSVSFVSSTCGDEWCYLSHCTRRPLGAWPDESREQYLDELITGVCGCERTPLNALFRIVSQQRICASGLAIRGGIPAVCLTAVPLVELPRLRAYQPQRQCWSFEAYGISIQRDWLVARGCRPVIYGDDQDWRDLSAGDRPFFQLRHSQRGGRRRDWSQELEWRHLGDIDLSIVPDDAAFLFVAMVDEAARLEKISRWPVTVCK